MRSGRPCTLPMSIVASMFRSVSSWLGFWMRCLKMLISASQLVASMLARVHCRRRCLCTPTGACLHPAWLFEARRASWLASPANEASMPAGTGGSRCCGQQSIGVANSPDRVHETTGDTSDRSGDACDRGSVSASALASMHDSAIGCQKQSLCIACLHRQWTHCGALLEV